MLKYKEEKKTKTENNFNNSNKTELKILSNIRGQYLQSGTKPKGITLCIIQ